MDLVTASDYRAEGSLRNVIVSLDEVRAVSVRLAEIMASVQAALAVAARDGGLTVSAAESLDLELCGPIAQLDLAIDLVGEIASKEILARWGRRV